MLKIRSNVCICKQNKSTSIYQQYWLKVKIKFEFGVLKSLKSVYKNKINISLYNDEYKNNIRCRK